MISLLYFNSIIDWCTVLDTTIQHETRLHHYIISSLTARREGGETVKFIKRDLTFQLYKSLYVLNKQVPTVRSVSRITFGGGRIDTTAEIGQSILKKWINSTRWTYIYDISSNPKGYFEEISPDHMADVLSLRLPTIFINFDRQTFYVYFFSIPPKKK